MPAEGAIGLIVPITTLVASQADYAGEGHLTTRSWPARVCLDVVEHCLDIVVAYEIKLS